MKYRAAIDSKKRVLLVAEDKDQNGPYCTIGTWCDFSFSTIPVSKIAKKNPGKLLFKVVGKKVVARTQKDLDKD